jgi:hypothetical protein
MFKDRGQCLFMQKTIFLLGLLLIGVFLFGCLQETVGTHILGDIISNPSLYSGKTVIIEGKFGGWGGNYACNNEAVLYTKSDSIIYDDSGCLYMVARASSGIEVLYKEKELDPMDQSNIGGNITIKAVVSLIDGKPILGKLD